MSYFSFQPLLYDWCNKGCGMCYPVYGIVHIKEPMLLIGKSSLCGGSRFPFSLSECSFTICLMPYNHKQNVLSASLNKTFPFLPSFLPSPHQQDSSPGLCNYRVAVGDRRSRGGLGHTARIAWRLLWVVDHSPCLKQKAGYLAKWLIETGLGCVCGGGGGWECETLSEMSHPVTGQICLANIGFNHTVHL